MSDQTEKVLFEIRLDNEQYKQETKLIRESLASLVLDIDKTKAAQKQLGEEYKAGTINSDAYAKRSVELRQQLRGQQADQRELTKGLETLEKTYNSAAGSIDQLKARSAELTTQYNLMSEAERKNTDEGKALTAELNQVNEALKAGGAEVGDFRRNVGNYTASFKAGLEPLVVELAKVRAQQQGLDKDSESFQTLERRAVGFQTAAVRAGAQAGLSFEQAEAKIQDYGKQIQPVVENLVRLEQEQEKIEEGSEGYRKIGFQIAALDKQLSEVPAETKKVSEALAEAADTTGVLGGVTQRYSDAKAKLTAVTNVAKAATLAEVGALGLLKIALAATGIGLLVLALGTLVTFLTKTQTGIDFVERKTKALGVVVGVLTDKVSAVGEVLFKAFDNPKQAISDLVDFIGENLLNRLKSFGVIVEGIVNLDPRKIADGFIQAGTGIADATNKAQAFTQELKNAAAAGEQIAAENQRIRDSERAVNVERAQGKKDIEALKLLAEDQTKSTQARVTAAQQAFDLEQKTISAQLQNQRDRIKNIEREQALTNNLTADNDALAEERVKLAELEEGSLTRQTELQNKINEIRKSAAADTAAKAKAAADLAQKALEKRLQAQREGYQLELVALEQQLKLSAEGSDEELALLEKKLAKQRQIELAAKDLTIGQKKIIDAKYEADRDALVVEQSRKRINLALQEEANNIAARLVAVQRGSELELQLQQQAIEKQRQQQLAAISERASADDRAAQERLINAQAESQQTDLIYQNRTKAVTDFYQTERNALEEARAGGLVTEQQYNDALYQQQLGSLSAQLEVAKRYGQDTAAIEQQLFDLRIGHINEVNAKDRAAKQQQLQTAIDFGAQLGQLFADTMSETGAQLQDFAAKALVLILDTISKAVIAAQVKIITEALASPESVATFGVAGFVKAGLIIAGLTAATAGLKASLTKSSPKQFAQGGVVHGPSHAQGGIPMYHRSGRYVGEMEGEEIILTRNVYRTPALRAAASALNVAAGGKSFAQGLQQMIAIPRHYAEGGIVRYDPATMDPMRAGQAGSIQQQSIDYERLAATLAQQLTPAFVAGAQALPAPTVRPTEFNRVADNERRTQLKSNN